MTIAIDARNLSKKLDGVGNYLLNSIIAICKNTNWKIILLSNLPVTDLVKNKLKSYTNIEFKENNQSNGFIWFLFKLPFLIKKIKLDIFWSPSGLLPLKINKNIKTLITLHDFVYLDFKGTMSLKNKVSNFIFFNKSIKKADYIWCVSNYTKNRLEELFPKRKSKKILVGSSIDFNTYKKISIKENEKINFLSKFGIKEPFCLFVGTIEPRKNIQFLLKIFPNLENLTLVIVGAKGWEKQELISEIINKDNYPKGNVKFLGYIENDDLVKLYNLAEFYISCSKNEGFGLPQLEAISCGCKVISPSNSAMIEVVKGCGILVKSWDEKEWINKINKLKYLEISNKNREKKLEEYNWDIIIKNLKDYLNSY